ncbi:MAG: MurR/RpiR family transcriptional regulator [Collinsella sp.]|nr:MurR/RpiR family transcriptional regulator [Collinsella sp.]
MVASTGVINAVLSSYKRMSEAERRIADVILSEQKGVSSLTAGEIAHRAGTSNTSVSRFVKTLGFDSFAHLRLALAREEAETRGRATAGSRTVTFEDVEGSARVMLDNKIEELHDTFAQLDARVIEKIARIIQDAGTVMFVGVGSSLSFAQMMAIKFSQVGIRAIAPATTDAAAITAMLLSSDDCIVFISNSGASRRLNIIMENAIDSATPTVVISGDDQSSLARRSSYFVKVSLRDQLLARDFMFSHSAANYVLELVLMLLYHESEDAGEYMCMFHKTFADEKLTFAPNGQ